MADRYTRIFIDEKEKYCVGSPIIIPACALLNDNKNNSVVAQVKLKNIGEKNIKAVKVSIAPSDTAGRSLGESVAYSFLDLNVKRDDYFGSQNAIPMSDNSTRVIEVKITEIIFSDNTIIDCSRNSYKPMPERRTLSSLFGDEQIVRQYKIKTSERARFEPVSFEDTWLCTCGAINSRDEEECHICKLNYFEQTNALDTDILNQEARERLNKEETERKSEILNKAKKYMESDTVSDYESAISELTRIKGFENADELIGICGQKINEIKIREKEEEQRQALLAKKKKRKTIILASAISSIVIITGTVAALWNPVIQPSIDYNTAVDLYNAGKYENAIAAFLALEGYRDSAEQITKCETAIKDEKYNAALELYNDGKFEEAIIAFERLGNWSDSKEYVEKSKAPIYENAIKFMNNNEVQEAILIFENLGQYKDSYEQLVYAHIQNGDDEKAREIINKYRIKSLRLPDSINKINDYAFYNCSSIDNITIPYGVTDIGEYAFYGCSSLKSIIIPESVKNIGKYSFYDCNSLYSVQLPNAIRFIRDCTFYDCYNLETVNIPESVTGIGNQAFHDCDSIINIILPSKLTSIGEGAFTECDKLYSVIIPEGVTTIRDFTFDGCSNLSSVTIPASVKNIGSCAFRDCFSLSSVTVPKGVNKEIFAFPEKTIINYL